MRLFHRRLRPCANGGHPTHPCKTPPLPSPHQHRTKPLFPRPQPANPHPFRVLMWEPCKPQPPIHPCFPVFPLPLNSTARFSKTRPNPISNTSHHIRQISTFPSTTVTAAGLLSSFFIQNPLLAQPLHLSLLLSLYLLPSLLLPLPFLPVIPLRGICFSLKMRQDADIASHTHLRLDFIATTPFSTTSAFRLCIQSTQANTRYLLAFQASRPVVYIGITPINRRMMPPGAPHAQSLRPQPLNHAFARLRGIRQCQGWKSNRLYRPRLPQKDLQWKSPLPVRNYSKSSPPSSP